MKTNEDGSDQACGCNGDEPERGQGCGCDAPGLSTRSKCVVCLIVGLVAAIVLARGIILKAGEEAGCEQQSFATGIPADLSVTSDQKAAGLAAEAKTVSDLWGGSLDSLAAINNVAAEKDAVFVLLPTDDNAEVEKIKKQIEAAAGKIVSKGTATVAFTLDKNGEDYRQIGSQAAVPCVLTLVKGGGMRVLSEDITEANLLQAVVAASRPSNCGPAASSSCCP